MIVLIKDSIVNLGAFDMITREDAGGQYKDRIGLWRDCGEVDYISFDSVKERDKAWLSVLKAL